MPGTSPIAATVTRFALLGLLMNVSMRRYVF